MILTLDQLDLIKPELTPSAYELWRTMRDDALTFGETDTKDSELPYILKAAAEVA
jgi:hypothetical protein